MHILKEKFKEVLWSVLPIVFMVLALSGIFLPVEKTVLWNFIRGSILIIFGMSIFLFGVDLGVEDLGQEIGRTLAKRNHIGIVAIYGFFLGFIITVAEPDLQILAREIQGFTGGALSYGLVLLTVGAGVGILVAIGLVRLIYSWPIPYVVTLFYGICGILALFTPPAYLGLAVDSSGATTGSMTVPFILAIGQGVAALKHGGESAEDSFGLLGIASIGPILAILLTGILRGNMPLISEGATVGIQAIPLWNQFLGAAKEVSYSIIPLIIVFYYFQKRYFHFSKRRRSKIMKGLIYAFLGLSLFMTGVYSGFMDLGVRLGKGVASRNHVGTLFLVGSLLGLTVILAEPAVYTLTKQVEKVSAGAIPRRRILVALSLGVAGAVGLSMLRIYYPKLMLWHFLYPGFALAIFLSFHVPPIFTGIAFDSGGVASGPMTATFILAFAQGAATQIPHADVLVDGFGVIAMVAMTPIIAITLLGRLYERNARKEGATK